MIAINVYQPHMIEYVYATMQDKNAARQLADNIENSGIVENLQDCQNAGIKTIGELIFCLNANINANNEQRIPMSLHYGIYVTNPTSTEVYFNFHLWGQDVGLMLIEHQDHITFETYVEVKSFPPQAKGDSQL